MPIKLSGHAVQQLRKRELSEKLVIQVVKEPDEILLSYRSRKLRRKKIGDKILEVVTSTEGSRITIITAYFLGE